MTRNAYHSRSLRSSYLQTPNNFHSQNVSNSQIALSPLWMKLTSTTERDVAENVLICMNNVRDILIPYK
jgi:hypothetical protein